MKSLKRHWNISKYGNSEFKLDRSPLVDLLYTYEIPIVLDVMSVVIGVVIFIKLGLVYSMIVSGLSHLFMTSCLAAVSTILERKWRRRLDAQKGLRHTLNRLALNKERRVNERKIGF